MVCSSERSTCLWVQCLALLTQSCAVHIWLSRERGSLKSEVVLITCEEHSDRCGVSLRLLGASDFTEFKFSAMSGVCAPTISSHLPSFLFIPRSPLLRSMGVLRVLYSVVAGAVVASFGPLEVNRRLPTAFTPPKSRASRSTSVRSYFN